MASLTALTTPMVARVRTPAASSSSSVRMSVHRRSTVHVLALGVGSQVKVANDVKVYHIPKCKGAEVNISGFQGEVVEVIKETDTGVPLSANLPNKVRVSGEVLDKGVLSFLVHLDDSELEEIRVIRYSLPLQKNRLRIGTIKDCSVALRKPGEGGSPKARGLCPGTSCLSTASSGGRKLVFYSKIIAVDPKWGTLAKQRRLGKYVLSVNPGSATRRTVEAVWNGSTDGRSEVLV
eukprot:CAMPEP_0118932082 /NCGR_PEP_ID=MMETSP1169-20130426/9027_1 /TAXON_ID=36882 /ORGANISM="Pyramimonas obovata, Strain CCMP722" /LENGTH=234 /DNA_ID=CAMNT_0006874679 /DNA_START=50 /DNA_END=755 /DNA_ORIENTATION=+